MRTFEIEFTGHGIGFESEAIPMLNKYRANPRGSSNGCERGNTEARRKRRQWLVATFPADMFRIGYVEIGDDGESRSYEADYEIGGIVGKAKVISNFEGHVASGRYLMFVVIDLCRCFRCGTLLSETNVTVDRIKPKAQGGTYAYDNIRPACLKCNSTHGNEVKKALNGR